MKVIICLSVLISVGLANKFNFQNKCSQPIWVGSTGNPGKGNFEGGSFKLNAGQTHTVDSIPQWAGRMWGRANCKSNVNDCAGGNMPLTLAEFTLGNGKDQDWYDVSLVDGYNLPMRVTPVVGTYKKNGNSHYDCNSAGCHADLNTNCPAELTIKDGGKTIACMSACSKFKTDEYCCRGAHDKPQTCKSKDWPKNYPAIFKTACPDAYSYAYDDTSSTFTCHGSPATAYDIVFCP